MSTEIRKPLDSEKAQRVFVLVAHPDDETLWAGGLLLAHPQWKLSVATLCRSRDLDRAPRFKAACRRLGAARSAMADLDDGPAQEPLSRESVAETIASLTPAAGFDLLITHSPQGEYTRHLRHEEAGIAAARLWAAGRIAPREVWMFAYADAEQTKSPEAIAEADFALRLSGELFLKKFHIITEVYGFDTESWEAKATPRVEAFWRFSEPRAIAERFGIELGGPGQGGVGS